MSLPEMSAATPLATPTASQPQKWFHFRFRVLLVIPLALLLIGVIYGPRQIAQRNAIAELEKVQASVRTQPIALPGIQQVFGDAYAQEVIEVYLVGPSYSDRELALLDGLSSLQKLELTDSAITPAGLSHLKGLSNLYTLHLSGTQVTDEGLQVLSGLPYLGVLSLDNTKISDSGLQHLARIQSLERLFLDHTQLTDAGMPAIGKLVNLKELTLTHTQVTDAGMTHLKGLVSLEILKLHDTKVSLEMMQQLAKALPNCVVWVPGAGQ